MSGNLRPVTIDEIVTHIYQGPLEPNPWQTFVRCLRAHLNCDIAVVALRPTRQETPALAVWDSDMPIEQEWVVTVMEEQSQLWSDNALPGRTPLKESAVEKAPADIAFMHYLVVAESSGWSCDIGIANGVGKNNFSSAEKDLLAALKPHFEYALKVHALLKRNEWEKKIYQDALERLSMGAVVLDGRGRVLEINRIAEELLAQSPYMAKRGGRIVSTDQHCQHTINRIVDDVCAWHNANRQTLYLETLRVECAGGTSIGMLIKSAPTQGYLSDASPSIVIYLSDLSRRQLAPEQLIAQLFGLTPSEALLATLLANGLTIAEAAAQLKLTESSARTYSKRIFAKTGITRQAELVRVILKSVALLATPPSL